MNREWQEDAAGHLEQLARRHRVMLHWRRRAFLSYEATIASRMVFIGKPTTVKEYLGGLHELGHVVSPRSRSAHKACETLTCEAAAWEWAFAQARADLVGELRERLRNEIGAAWATYLPR